MLNNKSILITGGTGSFGKELLKFILTKYPKVKKIVIFSRDELKQFELSQKYTAKKFKNLRFFLGDVRDESRLVSAFENIDYVIHAAALKQVPAAEYNPYEFIKTNILGAQNVISAAIKRNVKKVIALSTDKAAAPINLYGATKLCSDKLFTSANNIIGNKKIVFSVVRYGNVMGSRGSVIPLFKKFLDKGFFPITDKRMTRFNITLEESIKMVMWSLKESLGGEIFVPKIPSYNILDLAKAMNPRNTIKIIGIRAGEKIHEEMITLSDSYNTYDLGKYYAIINPSNENLIKVYNNFKKFPCGKSYNSFDNKSFLTIQQIKKLISKSI